MGFLPIFLLLSQDAPGLSGGPHTPHRFTLTPATGQQDLREHKGGAGTDVVPLKPTDTTFNTLTADSKVIFLAADSLVITPHHFHKRSIVKCYKQAYQ